MTANLTSEQQKFIESEGKVIVKACPGSGKTYSVAKKFLSYLDKWDSSHQGIAILSFTNVASDEIYEKIELLNNYSTGLDYPHFIGTVDSFINEFIVLRYGYLLTEDRVRPKIALSNNWDIPFKWWRGDCHRNGCIGSFEEFHYGIDGKFYRDNTLVTCKPNGKSRTLPCQQYKKMLENNNIIFQNETAHFAYKLLKKFPIISEALIDRFPIIIVDEAQDTSEEQMAVFDLLTEAGIKSIFLVGDPDQAIYEWRDAKPEYFLKKLEDESWKTIELTGNFRSSQNICNATSEFSASLRGVTSNKAIGTWKNEHEKPILLLTNGNSEHEIVQYFLDKCNDMSININADNVAILTRGRIHSDTNVLNLWKSNEIERFSKAIFEWNCGSRKNAIKLASKASYTMFFGEEVEESIMTEQIQKKIGEFIWREFVIDILSGAPCIDLPISNWVNQFSIYYNDMLDIHNLSSFMKINVSDYFKIKSHDKNSPSFKSVPLIRYFEKKQIGKYTKSSIHGVKGETYDAVLINVKKTGKTLTAKFLTEGDLNEELMRIAYVAMTRPRRLLVIAMPGKNNVKDYPRFSHDNWNYEWTLYNIKK